MVVNIDQSLITCAVASTGLAGPANGIIDRIFCCAASGMRGNSRPSSAAASAIWMPTPPEIVTTPTRGDFGNTPPEHA